MELTDKQLEAIDIAVARYEAGEKYTTIAGYSGCGKTTAVKYIIAALHVNPDNVVYASFTGKACTVLQRMGNKNVSTLHKLLYEHIPKPDGTFWRKIREEIPYEIVVADECSMIPNEMVQLLLRYDIYIIFIGDPFQLPPVSKDASNNLLENPHIFLDEVVRQSLESDIIKISMDVRNGKRLPKEYQGTDIQIIPKAELSEGMLEWADIVICATNKTRHALNKQMREMKGHTGDLQIGDKIICTKNNWDIVDNQDNALVNGTIGYVNNIKADTYIKYPPSLFKQQKLNIYDIDFTTEFNTQIKDLDIDKNRFDKGEATVSRQEAYKINRSKKYKGTLPEEFDYGYAITCHKAQGSTFDNVLVIEENFPFDAEEHARWIYTSITRAAKKVVLVR